MSDSIVNISQYLQSLSKILPMLEVESPWTITTNLENIVRNRVKTLPSEFIVNGEVAVHEDAKIEENVTLKGPIIISSGCFVGAHAYLRGGVFLDEHVVVGPGCEVKTSIILNHSALAHFNFVGDSLLGVHVNMEAGSVIANHYNERADKTIYVALSGRTHAISVKKFGALVGDHTKIGANAVLSPGTILPSESIVARLELIDQVKKLASE
jgi:NDP-sugar pyrophosphorylase family protein